MISKIRGTLCTPVTIGFSIVAGMLSVSLTGCTAVAHLSGIGAIDTVTSRDVGFSGHPTRIYIVSNLTVQGHPMFGISLDDDVQKRMIPDIERCGGHAVFDRAPESAWRDVAFDNDNTTVYYKVNTQSLAGQLLDGTLLNQDGRKARMGQFEADVVLTMDFTIWLGTGSGWGIVDSRVWDLRAKKFVWRAHSRENFGIPFSMSADAFVTDLMRKLRADGMVPACGNEPTGASQAVGATTGHNDGSAPDATAPSH